MDRLEDFSEDRLDPEQAWEGAGTTIDAIGTWWSHLLDLDAPMKEGIPPAPHPASAPASSPT